MTETGDTLAPGTRLDELEIERVLGAGGFGVTYLARDVSLDAWRAVKEYLPPNRRHRLVRRAHALRPEVCLAVARLIAVEPGVEWGQDVAGRLNILVQRRPSCSRRALTWLHRWRAMLRWPEPEDVIVEVDAVRARRKADRVRGVTVRTVIQPSLP